MYENGSKIALNSTLDDFNFPRLAQNVMQYHHVHVCRSQTTSGLPVMVVDCFTEKL